MPYSYLPTPGLVPSAIQAVLCATRSRMVSCCKRISHAIWGLPARPMLVLYAPSNPCSKRRAGSAESSLVFRRRSPQQRGMWRSC